MLWRASTALSMNTPVSLPFLSRTILPPGGSGVFSSIPAIARALLLTHTACPSTRVRKTGTEADTRSSDARVGNPFPGQRF